MCDYLCNNQEALFVATAVYLFVGIVFSIYSVGIAAGYEGEFPKDLRRILRTFLVSVLVAIFWVPLAIYVWGKTEGKKKREGDEE